MADDIDAFGVLRAVECFAGLTDGEVSALAGQVTRRRFEAGDVIIREDDRDTSMFVLAAGRLTIRMVFRDTESPQVGIIEPGDLFGEMALLTGKPRSATVTADAPSEVLEIAAEGIQALIKKRPDVQQQIRRIVTDRQAENLKTVMVLANEQSG